MKKLIVSSLLVLAAASVSAAPASASGRIVLAHDEWTLSNAGFAAAPDTGQYALNVANWFTGGSAGNFLVRSSNFGLTESSLQATMTGAGHTWTIDNTTPITLAYLQQYDAVFLCNSVPDMSILTSYVVGGGCVYLAGGTGQGNATVWDPFLSAFGLDMGDLNFECCVLPITSTHAIFTGVSGLYQNNGNDVADLDANDPSNQVLETDSSHGLYAIYDGGFSSPIVLSCRPGIDAGVIPCPCDVDLVQPGQQSNAPTGGGLGCGRWGQPGAPVEGGAGTGMSGTLDAVGSVIGSGTGTDTVRLVATGLNSTALTVFWAGTLPVHPTGVIHGVGVRCVTANLKRLYIHPAVDGTASAPQFPDAPLSVRTAQQYGIAQASLPGQTFLYFCIYRDPQAGATSGSSHTPPHPGVYHCPGMAAATVNLTNSGSITW